MAGNASAVQVRIEAAGLGQRAHDLRIGPQPGYVVSGSSGLNRILIEPLKRTELRTLCLERRARRPSQKAMRSNATVDVAGIITFGKQAQVLFEALDADAQDTAYREVAEAMALRLDTSLSGLVVHRDETAPHAHFQLPGVTHQGYPVSGVAKIGALRDLQTIAAQVMARHAPGIERGTSKALRLAAGEDYADVVHRLVSELHADLPAEAAAKEARAVARIAELQAQIAEGETKVRVNEERTEKARLKAKGEGEKARKAAKNVETYERRANAAKAELKRLTAELGTREAALETREAAVAAKEADLTRREKALATEAQWTARAMGNLAVAVDQAMTGRHLEEITAEDMADKPKQFAVLRDAAPEGRPTRGFQSAFWAHNFSDSGLPSPLSQKVREASEKAFAKVAVFARDRLALLAATKDQAWTEAAAEIEAERRRVHDNAMYDAGREAKGIVEAAKSAAERQLEFARQDVAEAQRSASEARSEALQAQEEARVLETVVFKREKRLDERLTTQVGIRERFFEDGFAMLSAALHKVLKPEAVAKVAQAYEVGTQQRNERYLRDQRAKSSTPPTFGSGYSP